MTSFPNPGTKVRGSRSGVPIMALFDLLGRRWTLGILWTLCHNGPCTFRDLQGRCGSISPTVLNARLKDLRQAGLIENAEGGYRATPSGAELCRLLAPLKAWARDWAEKIDGKV